MVHVCTRACMSEASECPCKRNHDDPNGPPHTPRLGGIPHLHIQDVTPVQTSSIYCLFIAYLDLLYCSIRMLHRYSAVGKSLHIHIRAHNTCIYIYMYPRPNTHTCAYDRACMGIKQCAYPSRAWVHEHSFRECAYRKCHEPSCG